MRTRVALLCAALCAALPRAQAQSAEPAGTAEAKAPPKAETPPKSEASEAPAPQAEDAPQPERAGASQASESGAEAAATSQTGAAPPPTPAKCFPACRVGFLCHEGACISACNPPCGEGRECTAEATCAPVTASAAAAGPGTVEPQDPAHAAGGEQPEKAEAAGGERWREAHRYDHHITADTAVRATILEIRDGDRNGDGDVVAAGYGLVSVGYMHNFVRYFGLRARLTLGLGGVGMGSVRDYDTVLEESDADGAFASLIELEVVPYAGNFGAFYVGPLGFVSYRGYEQDALQTEADNGAVLRTFRLNDNAIAGAGLGFGVLLGRMHDMHLSWSVRTTFNSTLPAEVDVGFGYRFGRFWSKAQP